MRFVKVGDRYINLDRITHIAPQRDVYGNQLPGITIYFDATDGSESSTWQATLHLNTDESARFLAALGHASAVYIA